MLCVGRPLSLLDLRLASRRTAIGPLISDEKERGKTKKKISSAVDIFFSSCFKCQVMEYIYIRNIPLHHYVFIAGISKYR